MSHPSTDLLDVLRELRKTERYLFALRNTLLGGQPETARAAYTAHDAVEALMDQLAIDTGATREFVRSKPAEDITAALETAVRGIVAPGTPVDRNGLRLAVRAQLRLIQGLPVDAAGATGPAVAVPTVGPDGSIIAPPEGPRALE